MQNKSEKKLAFKMHTLICWNMHTVTIYKTFIRTNITKLYFKIRRYYVTKKKKTFFCLLRFPLNVLDQHTKSKT